MTIAPAMAKLNHDPIKDFAPISAVAINGFVLVVHKDFPPKTLAEFITYVKASNRRVGRATAVRAATDVARAHLLDVEVAQVIRRYTGNGEIDAERGPYGSR